MLALGLLSFYYFLKPRLGFGDIEILLVIALALGLSPTLYVTVLATSLALLYFCVCKLKRQPLQAVPLRSIYYGRPRIVRWRFNYFCFQYWSLNWRRPPASSNS